MQQLIGEWDFPLSEPSWFSYNHTLKVTKNCLFPKAWFLSGVNSS